MNPLPARPAAAPSLAERLGSNIAAQRAAAESLAALVAAERERMLARDWDAILRLCTEKETAVQHLQALAREFEQLCAGRPVSEVVAAHGLADTHALLLDQAARLQRANREARALLDHHQARVNTALRLMNRTEAAGLYGRHGQAGVGAGVLSQRLASA